ncbi:MAG: acetyl-CoA carboxylase biotin carboxylase subunit [Rhodospirillales bacterium]|nr:acetyl-CoA carboxylase biotin carboxylase subunit [Rhodospirillales bacterium]MBO6786443.1 acetyl-CoA carboxylase biotin carboxylase subunit [Rhodospirillales bacterium]
MFKKILIANRGEIACRVIKTARAMGISTVAVYSDADRDALHVQMADEAVHIGASPTAESYLVIDRILQAIKDTGAEAVHPGYGFLSENTKFAQALEKAGVAFIGPGPKAITAMGDKIESKKLANAAKVSCVPGHPDAIADVKEAVKVADDIGYPVMLKASAGGGGKGMRIAWNAAEAEDGFVRATNEAKSSFGDDRVFVEKFIEDPRHIEIQIIADKHGNTVYLGERECSIQRRHQKVIEEAPSPFLDEKTRKAMGEQAVALAAAVDYHSAGTVEFIVDKDKNFYFLEMNTRLQVEHPVTEYITGLDLVELMIRVADGEKLPFKQDDIKLNGWAIESRIYAEDPFRNFLPSIGRLAKYRPPVEEQDVRVDTGVYEGGEISMFYDPMIAKLITYGPDRAAATNRMQRALDEFLISGVQHNIPFLNALMTHPRFVEGRLTTNFIAEEYPDGFNPSDTAPKNATTFAAVAAVMHAAYQARAAQISGQQAAHTRKVSADWVVVFGDAEYKATVGNAEDGTVSLTVDGEDFTVATDWQLGDPLFPADINGETVCFQVARSTVAYVISQGGIRAEAWVLSPHVAELNALMPVKEPPDTSKLLLSPMPGLLVSVAVAEGQEVKAGEELCVVEAMKMENVLRAERDCTVAAVKAEAGANLAVDQVILEFE